ncbi:hypothetical protein CSV72_14250 [Sporosarcina sp. P20a]|nr:hypothetical protein CSV72_14250 [Sporosarcina sp. P20a]
MEEENRTGGIMASLDVVATNLQAGFSLIQVIISEPISIFFKMHFYRKFEKLLRMVQSNPD